MPNSDEVDLTEASPAKAVPEEVQKYFKMVQVGVPVQAVKLKMERDGFDPTLLD